MIEALSAIVGEKNIYTDLKVRKVFSTDALTFSPVLVEAIGDKVADIVVVPGDADELREIIAYAVREGVPFTVRGAGTGNYGQSVPLLGGIQILTRRLTRILEINPEAGSATVEPGVLLGTLERQGREHGLELRCYPSTWATATVGGFVGGGFGGVGSIRNGTLFDGAVRGVKLLTAEAEPRLITLDEREAQRVIHAYGVTGVVTELTLALAKAHAWEESVLSFPTLAEAVRFGHALATDATFDKRLVSLNAWPIPSFFKPLVQDGGVQEGRAAVLLELGEGQTPAAATLAERFGGTLDWQRPAARYQRDRFALSSLTWNHTTLWAMRADPRYTYLQANFNADPDAALEQIAELNTRYGDEMPLHLEYILSGGQLSLSALPLVYYEHKARLYEIIDTCEALGVAIADPHTWRLDHDPRWNGKLVVEAKAAWNPTGLLNPGKLGDPITGEIKDETKAPAAWI